MDEVLLKDLVKKENDKYAIDEQKFLEKFDTHYNKNMLISVSFESNDFIKKTEIENFISGTLNIGGSFSLMKVNEHITKEDFIKLASIKLYKE